MSRNRGLPALGQPLNQAFRSWWERLEDSALALAEFQRALQEGQLVADRYEKGQPLKRMKAAYWRKARLVFDREEPLCVVVVEGDDVLVQARFYISEPARNDRLSTATLPAIDTPTAFAATAAEVPNKRGRRADHSWVKIRTETLRRVFNNGQPVWPKSVNALAFEIENWCLEQFGKAPVNSDLRLMIDDVVGKLRALLS